MNKKCNILSFALTKDRFIELISKREMLMYQQINLIPNDEFLEFIHQLYEEARRYRVIRNLIKK
jgi:hypothetical protein